MLAGLATLVAWADKFKVELVHSRGDREDLHEIGRQIELEEESARTAGATAV